MRPGEPVDVVFTKWGGGGHWEFPCTFLGSDEHGTWVGGATGALLARPDHAFTSKHDWVMLFPDGRPWVASFYDSPAQPVATYVDMTTEPIWDGRTVSMVDLDLDVVQKRDGTLFLDDEDEFDAHRVALAYPDEVVRLARRTADELMAAVGSRQEPFGDAGPRWLRAFTGRQ